MIEYLAPASGGGGGSLTYPIQQVTVDLSNQDFTTLNSAPLVILPPDPATAYCILSIITDWENINWSSFYVAYYEMTSIAGGSYGTFNDTIHRTTGISTSVIPLNTTVPNINARKNRGFQLTSNSDNGGISFSRFFVTVTYIYYNL
jgi:hypothetical protein